MSHLLHSGSRSNVTGLVKLRCFSFHYGRAFLALQIEIMSKYNFYQMDRQLIQWDALEAFHNLIWLVNNNVEFLPKSWKKNSCEEEKCDQTMYCHGLMESGLR